MKLKDYLDSNGIKYTSFAKKIGVTLSTIYNIFKGNDIRLSIAIKIHQITKGEVSFEDLKPLDLKLPES